MTGVKSEEREAIRIVRLSESNDDAIRLLEEYYEAVDVIQRDTPEVIAQIVTNAGSGLWLAYRDGEAVGCVVLRRLTSIAEAGECKRLYVRPDARGLGIADGLMDALEDFAMKQGYRWVYLDSHDGLKAAIRLYLNRGYKLCDRYNDNPQATEFLRKALERNARKTTADSFRE